MKYKFEFEIKSFHAGIHDGNETIHFSKSNDNPNDSYDTIYITISNHTEEKTIKVKGEDLFNCMSRLKKF